MSLWHHAKILRNLMIQFQENIQKEGKTEGLFQRTLLATAGRPTSTTAADWRLRVKDIEYDVDLTKKYCITVSMYKISSIHKPVYKI